MVLSTRYTASMMAMCDLKLSTPHPATHSVRHVEIQQLITHIAAHAAPLELGKDNADIGDTLHLKQLRAKRGCAQLVRNKAAKQQMLWSILQRTIFDLELLALLGELLVWEGLAANSSCRVAQGASGSCPQTHELSPNVTCSCSRSPSPSSCSRAVAHTCTKTQSVTIIAAETHIALMGGACLPSLECCHLTRCSSVASAS